MSCSLILGCRYNETVPVYHEGTWLPKNFMYREKQDKPSKHISYSLLSGSLLCCHTYESRTDSPYMVETIRMYELQSDVSTFIRDNSILIIDEHYSAIDSFGQIVKTFAYKREVDLTEQKKDYHGLQLGKDTILSSHMDVSGRNNWDQLTELHRVK